ncbi:MAG: translation initiation factor IF-2 subunit alpha [Candidatus Altiarchaeota archaeon]|nr:translation initiation factor IF-2 subunit alpha [Candidatus Altiarchaeota archaeon]
MEERYPQVGELVVANVERVVNYGAFVRLEEYDNKQGIVNIRDFSLKWVKNPRDYLKEGQKAVLKVLRVNRERGHIDLSLKNVNESERRNKLKEFKLEKRSQKLLSHFSKVSNTPVEKLRELFANALEEDYGTLYNAFSDVSLETEDLKDYIKDEKLRKTILKEIKNSIKPPQVGIMGYLVLTSEDGDGITKIKKALTEGEKTFTGDIEGSITYVSPPNYRIEVKAADYKTAEKIMKGCYEKVLGSAKALGVEAEFKRELK